MKFTVLQQAIFLGAIGFIGVVFLYYQFAIKPINNEIASLQTTLEQKKKDLEDAKRIVAKYVEFKKRQDSVQRELEWIQNRIPKSIDRPKLVEAINFLQNRSGVFLTNLGFSAQVTSKDGTYVEVPTTVSFNSDYKGLLVFMYQVSLSNLFVTVRDLTVTAATDPNHPNVTLLAQMTLSGIQAKP
jgi:Tfp pilus assembly protein PilO